MKYKLHKLDGRHSYRRWFQYYVGFHSSMNYDQGPAQFARAQHWCFDTWGWSAEIRQWSEIYRWHAMSYQTLKRPFYTHNDIVNLLPQECNQLWSWSNGYNDLRIYLATDRELAFFQLAHQLD